MTKNPLGKPQDGFMARHFDRRISGAITRRLAKTPLLPNHITAVSIAIGLLGALLLISTQATAILGGTFLLLLHSVVDGCDGELARLKGLESRVGAALDFFGDNLVHIALFSCLAVGLWRTSDDFLFLWLGFSANLGTLASSIFYFSFSKTHPSPLTPHPSLIDRLAQRDFLYLLPFLALTEKLSWFLWMAAIGSPAFFLVLLFLEIRKPRTDHDNLEFGLEKSSHV
ncbi:MAG: CDP-alcohol phosphatidyltransferase family protein [Elusimicrobia bacterium]|nr:CDP-alcohol phosphatidyltransferase family protein [Elusimicrobiota bacterium]